MKIGVLALKLMRWNLRRNDKKNYGRFVLPDGVTRREDIDVLGDGVKQSMIDVYYAPKEKRLGRVLLDIHGGAYIYGTRKNNRTFASVFLQKGYDVVLLDYPLNGAKGIDCQVQASCLAKQLRYVYEHAEELDLNPDGFYLTGDSAGGHYALLLAEMCGSSAFSEQFGTDVSFIPVRAVAVNCPAYDFARIASSEILTRRGRRFMMGARFLDPDYLRLLSPKEHLDALQLPVFVSSCRNDFIKEEPLDLMKDLESHGMEHEKLFLDSEDQEVAHVHNVMRIYHPESIRVNDAMDAFFSRY